jgi:predicted DNA-binding transcriptional regulator YafY
LLGIAADQTSYLTVERLIDFSLGYSILKGSELHQKKSEVRLSPKMELLKAYCEKPVRVRILYSEDQSERYISPLEIKQKGMRLYLKAYCHRDGIEKTFRADRIQSIGAVQEEETFL